MVFEKGFTPWNKGIKGYATSWKGKYHSEETKSKISKANKGKHPKAEWKKGHCPWNKGISMSEESKLKLSKASIGKHHSEKTKLKMKLYHNKHPSKTQFKKGHIMSKETKDKIIKALIGKPTWNKGIPHSKETKLKIKESCNKPENIKRLKEARAKQIFPLKDTTIEVKIQNFLKQLGIEYFTHQYMKIEHGYQCDVLIPSMNMVIECDGDYWHKYPVGRDIDKIRTSELSKKGFKVLRLWEHEINKLKLNEFRNLINYPSNQ